VELGALVVTHGANLATSTQAVHRWSSTWPVVGKTVLERWVDKVRGLGVDLISVIDQGASRPHRIETMAEWAQQGVSKILLILLGSYAEIDLTDLVHFHHQGGHRITKVYDPEGPLGISLLDGETILKSRGLHTVDGNAKPSRYDFLGYVTRLSSTVAYRKLVQDALDGRCDVRPTGIQKDERTWIDPTADVHPSAQIQGPCYIGARTKLNSGVIVTAYSSVERDSEIDVGTTLECTSILPNTYVSPGLYVRNSVVDGNRLENLDRGISVDLGPIALARRNHFGQRIHTHEPDGGI
jgi:hypothetical protein